jgi:pimeloyl-ACP methyl ester carboxylesterase
MNATEANTTTHRAESRGATIAYSSAGVGEPATMFIHGVCADRSYFQPQISPLSQGRRVLALDLRGHGESSPADEASLDDLASDVVAVADHAGLERVVLCGHSMGGPIALRVAAARPDLVRGIVMLDGVVLFPEPVRDAALQHLVPMLATEHWKEALRGFFNTTILEPQDPPDLRRRVITAADGANPGLVRTILASLFASDHSDDLRRSTARLLYVHGKTPADVQRLRALRPDATVEQIGGCGHYLMLTAPARVNALLTRFLESATD